MLRDFPSLCIKSAREDDKSIFLDWERGKISTEECLKLFLNHNQCFTDFTIDDINQFGWWLRSLGYIRRYKL